MVTARRLFEGETVSDSLAAILTKEPDLAHAPVRTRRLLASCLEKDPRKRLRDIADVWLLLNSERAAAAPSHSPQSRFGIAGWVAAVGVPTALLAALAFIHFREKPPETPVVRSTILPPEKNNFFFDYPISGAPALSPDGRRLVFAARAEGGVSTLWVRPLDSTTAQPLADTDNGAFPFWSPDGRFIGFGADGKLKKIAISGGPSVTLADAPNFRGGSWGSQGVILFAANPAGPLQKVAEAGGTATVATAFDPARREYSHRWPWFLPDGRHFLFASVVRASTRATIYQGSIDSPQESRIVAQTNTNAVYASGCILYLRETTLMAQPFDLTWLATAGEAVPIAERVAGIADSEFGFFTVSNNATLLFQSSAQAAHTLAVLDRSGKQLANAGDADPDSGFAVSPDGKRALLSLRDRSTHNSNLWIYDFARNLRSRFAFGATSKGRAVWSPDGSEIIFNSNPKGHMDLYRKPANGGATEELLFADNVDKFPTSASPDGKFVMYSSNGGPTDPKEHLWALPLQGERKPFPFSPSAFEENDGTFSHDGKWVAYASDESGRFEIYIAPFHGTGGKRQVSVEGGFGPVWRADGKELFFIRLIDGRLMAAEIAMKGSGLEIGAVRPLFGGLSNGGPYDAFADGQRFLVSMPKEQAAPVPLTLVQNWILSGHPKTGQWWSPQNRPMRKQSGQAIVLPCRADFSKV